MAGIEATGDKLPAEVWQKLAQAVAQNSIADLTSFSNICRASRKAVEQINERRHDRIRAQFQTSTFEVDQDLIERTVLVHLVPRTSDSLVIVAEVSPGMGEYYNADNEQEGAVSDGFEISWIQKGSSVTKQLIVPGLHYHASSVSNVKFSPDGSHLALLLTIDSGVAYLGNRDPIQRLSGPPSSDQSPTNEKIFEPSDECVLVVVQLQRNDVGEPSAMNLTAFPHAFVPEYGFDMLWRTKEQTSAIELAFAGILHSSDTAALFLASWSGWSEKNDGTFQFIARLPGAATELIIDKEDAMRVCTSTRVTSRIELSNDLTKIFFDTFSKFGVFEISHINPRTNYVIVQKAVEVPSLGPVANPFKNRRNLVSPKSSLQRLKTWSRQNAKSSSQKNVTHEGMRTGCMYSPIAMNGIQRPAKTHPVPEGQLPFRHYLPWRGWFSFSEAKKVSAKSDDGRAAMKLKSAKLSGQKIPETAIHIASALRSVFKEEETDSSGDSDASPSTPWACFGSSSAAVSQRSSNGEDAERNIEGQLVPMKEPVDQNNTNDMPLSTASMCGVFRSPVHPPNKTESNVFNVDDENMAKYGNSKLCFRSSSTPSIFSNEENEEGAEARTSLSNSISQGVSVSTWSSSRSTTSSNLIMRIGTPGNWGSVASSSGSSKCRRIAFNKSALASSSPRISTMSPDGNLICSVYISKLAEATGDALAHLKCVEVRKTSDGSLVFRNCSVHDTTLLDSDTFSQMRFEKAHEIVANTCGFSDDSSIIWVRDVRISAHFCTFSRRLPTVFRASDGAVLRTFSENLKTFKHIQLATNGLTLYGTRFCSLNTEANKGYIYVDAYDVVTGEVLATKEMAGPLKCPDNFNSQAVYLTSPSTVRAISRGDVDALWESTRGSVGCRWATPQPNFV